MKASLSNSQTIDITDLDSSTEGYQAVDVLEFNTDSIATAVILDEFDLQGEFRSIEINVLENDSPIEAELEKPDATTWIVRLPRPLPLKRINIRELEILHVAMAGEIIAAGFLDFLLPEHQMSVGAAVVAKSKAERVTAVADAQLRAGEKLFIGAETLDIFPVIGDKIMDQSIATLSNNEVINNLTLDAFAVRAKHSSGFSRLSLLADYHHISVYVDSQPQGLTLGLAPVTNDSPELEKMVELNGFNLQSNQETVPLEKNDAIWLKGLQGFLDENFNRGDGSGSFKVGLVLRSENPCDLRITQFDNDYRLLFRDLDMFPDIDASDPDLPLEQNLTFAGTHWQSYTFQLSLPASSVLRSAVLPFKHTLNKDTFSFVGDSPSERLLASAPGVEVTTNQWAGGTFQLDSAQSVRYLLLPLMATVAESVCALEIREDINGSPSGAIITEQSLSLTEVGKRAWMVVALDEPLALYSKKLWWLVKTTQGSAVQFAQENAQGSGISHFSLSETGGPAKVFRFTRELNVTPFFAKDNTEGFKLHLFLDDGNSWLPVASSQLPSGNLQQFDLLALLTGHSSPQAAHKSIRVSTLLKGKAVLNPAEISYDLEE